MVVATGFSQGLYGCDWSLRGQQPDVGWDGTYGGKSCDMDIYFYDVKFDCGKNGERVEYKSAITLLHVAYFKRIICASAL
jgi:hypothetical protein